ncbi:hypothetical protein FZEAL_5166 [Fusarium zealandicum]|uniref:Amidohydrolase-related domain-containing protein n=1 Tax=Fusarium zealandicum TaxID=1053134 RepID=A0A8H4XK15_9HYPO|nr:hypothetical protein FZEAL_5166 [Fusarium zealandicum]
MVGQLNRFIALASCVSCTLAKSTLFEHGTVITFDEETQTAQYQRNTSLLITDDRIAAIFDHTQTNVTIPPDTEVIDATDDIISPGFIDTHRHVWQTVHRSLGGDTVLGEYLTRWSSPLTAGIFDPEIMYYSELTGLCEALDAGVTTLVDYASGGFTREIADASIQANLDSGIRSFYAYAIGRGMAGFPMEDQIDHFQAIMENQTSSLFSLGLAYETFDVGTREDIEEVARIARTSNISLLETHFVGGPFGVSNSPTILAQLGLLNESFPIIFVHGNSATVTDATLLRENNQYIAMAPEFEMHHGADSYSATLIQDQASLSVGTHYTFSGDLVSQARIWLQTVRNTLFPRAIRDFKFPVTTPMSSSQAFLLATRSGGLALRRPDLGVLRPGAKADVVVFDGSAPGLLGWSDPITAVILQSHVGHVKHVMVDGQWRKRAGELRCAPEQQDVQAKFLSLSRKVQAYWARTPGPDLEGAAPGTGALYSAMDRIDVVRGPMDGF